MGTAGTGWMRCALAVVLTVAVLGVKGKIPIIILHYGSCADIFPIEQAAVLAGEVYYVGELECHYHVPVGTKITQLNINAYWSQDTEAVSKYYPTAAEKGVPEVLREYQVRCIQRHHIIRDVMKEQGIPLALYLDTDVLLYVAPDVLYGQASDNAGESPDIILARDTDGGPVTYISFWTQAGIAAMADFMVDTMRANPGQVAHDMMLTNLYCMKNKEEAAMLDLSSTSAPLKAFVLQDMPLRDDAVKLSEVGIPIIFDSRFHANETIFMQLPPEQHVRISDFEVRVKRVFFCDKRPLLYDERTQQFVLAGALHFRGPMKEAVMNYRSTIRDARASCVCDDYMCNTCVDVVEFHDQRMPEIMDKFDEACDKLESEEEEYEEEAEVY